MNREVIRQQTRNLLDEHVETFWSNAELNELINASYQNYLTQLIDAEYDGLLTTPALLNIVAGTETVALPADFYKERMLERVIDNKAIPLKHRDRYEQTNITSGATTYLPTYAYRGTNIVLEPTPPGSYTNGLKLHYWPVYPEMALDAATPTTAFREPWHKMLYLDAAIMARGGREQEDNSRLMMMLQRIEMPFLSFIESITAQRQYVEPFNTY